MQEKLIITAFNRFSAKALVTAFVPLAVYSIWIFGVVGFRSDHLFLILFCLVLYFLSAATRKFITAFFIFIIYWIVYDSMRIYPNYLANPVHIREPYDLEKLLFGFNYNGKIITPNEFFQSHTHAVLDIVSGIFYLNWVPVPLAFAFYLLAKDKTFFLRFAYAFVLTNFIGFVIYYLYPAAPPWYIAQHGFEFELNTPSSTAGLARFDAYFGIQLFQSIYSKNANIFAAIPSLHASYPVVVLFYGLKRKMGWINYLFLFFLTGVWFAAVYLNHHYFIDVIIGAACAVLSIFIFENFFKLPKVNNWFAKLAARI